MASRNSRQAQDSRRGAQHGSQRGQRQESRSGSRQDTKQDARQDSGRETRQLSRANQNNRNVAQNTSLRGAAPRRRSNYPADSSGQRPASTYRDVYASTRCEDPIEEAASNSSSRRAPQRSRKRRSPLVLIGAAAVVVLLVVAGIIFIPKLVKDDGIGITNQEEVSVNEETAVYDGKNLPSSASIACTPLNQGPELPSGCEVTSLACALGCVGFTVDKTQLMLQYVPWANFGEATLDEAFIGDPWSSNAYGCHACVIAEAAKAYLAENSLARYSVTDLTGSSFDKVLKAVSQGAPVCVWVTEYMEDTYGLDEGVTENGDTYEWAYGSQCMCLVGYDLEKNEAYLADPYLGALVTYKLPLVEQRFDEMGKQAVAISVKEV